MEDRLIRKLGIAGLIIIVLLGLLLSFIASYYIRDEIINITGNISAYLLENSIVTQISPRKLVSSDSKDIIEAHKFMKNTAQTTDIKIIKVWDTHGRLFHSTMNELEGKKFPLEPELKEALAGHSNYKLFKLNKKDKVPENIYYKKLYEVYVPIRDKTNNRVIGVFEVYWDIKELASLFTKIFYFVLAIMMLGFVVTYLGTYLILKKLLLIIKEKDLSISCLTRRLEDNRMHRAYTGTIQSLLTALDAKDKYTAGHSLRVADYAIKIASLLGMEEENIKLIEEAALFHDIGKIAISERILNKSSILTKEEYDKVKKHSAIGEQIVQASGVLEKMAYIIRSHHERIDGQGYPDGLSGDAIPLEAQILGVADTFDALTSNRPYRKALSLEQAIKVLKDVRGSQLNSELVNLFVENLDK